jgi:SAM-dependent methyltransferase
MFPRFPSLIKPALALFLVFGAASVQAQEEVPFITTPDNVTLEMLRIADVKSSDYVIDLGSGDGRIVIVAAARFGARGLGVEIVPQLVEKSIDSARRAGVEDRAQFRELDIFKADLTPASVVTLYLLPEFNLMLRPSLLALKPGTRIVSHDWDMAEWKPDRTVVVDVPDKKVGREKLSRVHLWVVPANVQGAWCGTGKLSGASLQVDQTFQEFRAVLADGKSTRQYAGRIDGAAMRTVPAASKAAAFTLDGDRLRVVGNAGKSSLPSGAAFVRRTGSDCRA